VLDAEEPCPVVLAFTRLLECVYNGGWREAEANSVPLFEFYQKFTKVLRQLHQIACPTLNNFPSVFQSGSPIATVYSATQECACLHRQNYHS
jgi:hypothetical protein